MDLSLRLIRLKHCYFRIKPCYNLIKILMLTGNNYSYKIIYSIVSYLGGFDEKQFACRILELINDEQKRINMGNAGRVKAQQYRLDKISLQWKSLFDELVKDR